MRPRPARRPSILPRTLLGAAALVLPQALGAAPELGLPIACTLGDDCFVLNYVDSDPGPGAADFTCGPQSYDGHKGTDIALPSYQAMTVGVAVLAAAPGVVRATRDGMPDLGLAGTPADLIDGRECGNGVVIDHGDGWETQYCHLAEGSIAVRDGARVERGSRLGRVGLSGRTEYPHVHLSVRHDGTVVDPFDGDGVRVCGADDGPGDDLWQDPPGYRAGGVVSAGLFEGVPDYEAVKQGTAHRPALAADAPALVGWVLAHGGRAGDLVEIRLTDPDGGSFLDQEVVLEKTQALLMRAAGRKRPADGWVAGDWTVEVRLSRDGSLLGVARAVATIGAAAPG